MPHGGGDARSATLSAYPICLRHQPTLCFYAICQLYMPALSAYHTCLRCLRDLPTRAGVAILASDIYLLGAEWACGVRREACGVWGGGWQGG
eukprot:3448795-Rhodomonas_salina.1